MMIKTVFSLRNSKPVGFYFVLIHVFQAKSEKMTGSRFSVGLLLALLCVSCAPCGAISALSWPGLGAGSILVAKGGKGTQIKGTGGPGCCGGLESVMERMKVKAKAKRQQAEKYFQGGSNMPQIKLPIHVPVSQRRRSGCWRLRDCCGVGAYDATHR